ncbi:FAD-dependent oxidoreductase [Micromonospora sagamiensis]|uniref:Assimilatory nitrate reductase (NADH) beta subunit n=1 Tax=Micromonospora sagamiensis TaxID=47875 RepID=A0A562WA18_9ACTN|nr:FAD-dependent oxidoreductase [Micromonospora sagamiensis]TWJ27129.1 assimilatory nitrate reductase (NADH) beta subunit [Micromonospora sagamiensis]BCL13978.1 FAD/NAD(P)-binding oxidoreductase [Micromonospora sagamiensis]
MSGRIVIVGYGMAGARLATELHARPGDRKVTVLGAEPHRAYNRIMLSTLLAGKVDERDVELTELAGQGVDVRAGVAVTAIDRAARTVRTATGEQLGYDHLVLATGSRAVVPPLAGLDPDRLPDRVVPFRTLDDCRRILAAARGARTVLVLGGGLLGLEAARGLAARGLDAHVVHPTGHLMERQLDPAAGAVLADTLARLGVRTHLAASATGVVAGADGVRLDLADGRSLDADLLVLACGVRPDTALATAAGLRVERGVVVDDRLRTDDPHVSAIGDCAQYDGVVGGLVAPAWAQARVVARLLTGEDAHDRYRPPPGVTRLKAAGIDLAAMGELPAPAGGAQAGGAQAGGAQAGGTHATGPAAGDKNPVAARCEELTFADPARGTYARLRITDDRLTGAILLGDNPAVGTVIQLFDRGAPVPADRRALLLGRTVDGPAGGAEPVASPALMPDATTVCRCNAVSKADLVGCWRAGARSVAEVVTATRAGTGCGSCRDAVAGIVEWLSGVDPVEVTR